MTNPTGWESTTEQAQHAARDVASTAREQAGVVADETRRQAVRVTDDVRRQLTEQAERQRGQAVSVLRTAGDELGALATDEQSALTQQLVRLSSGKLREVADHIETHGPEELLGQVRDFARRRPGAFLLMAGVAGVVAGRVVRGAAAAKSDSGAPAAVPPIPAGPPPVNPTEDTLVYSTTTPGLPAGDVDLREQQYAGNGTTDWERTHG